MRESIRKLAVIGLGRFGLALARSLKSAPHIHVVAVDARPEIVDRENQEGQWATHFVGFSQEALLEMGIDESIDLAVVAIGEDSEACQRWILALSERGVRRIYARAQTDRMSRIIGRLLGVPDSPHQVIRPEHSAARRMARTILLPGLADVVDLRNSSHSVATMPLPARYVGKNLQASGIRDEYGLNVLLVLRAPDPETGHREEVVPVTPETVLQEGDEITVLGVPERFAGFAD